MHSRWLPQPLSRPIKGRRKGGLRESKKCPRGLFFFPDYPVLTSVALDSATFIQSFKKTEPQQHQRMLLHVPSKFNAERHSKNIRKRSFFLIFFVNLELFFLEAVVVRCGAFFSSF
jgi:hypothetical protein